MKLKTFVRISTCLVVLATVSPLSAQKIPTEKTIAPTPKLMWFDFTEVTKFNDKWSHMVEVSERFYVKPKTQTQLVFRTYGLYNVGAGWSIGQGFAVFLNKEGDLTVHELRPEQQFNYSQKLEKLKKLGIAHRIRVEERLTRKTENEELVHGYNFAMRFRYRLGFDYTLFKFGKGENPFKVVLSDEIFLNAGKNVVYNIFDQNRVLAGISCQLVKGLTLTAAYMNIFKQKKSGDKFDKTHTFRFSFQYQFALKKKKKD